MVHGALKLLEKAGSFSEICWPLIRTARCLQPETSILRIVRNLFLALLLVLLLPYLLVPLYRGGHPVSTLMAWRYITGAPV